MDVNKSTTDERLNSDQAATDESTRVRKRLLLVSSHVVQYSSPIFRELAQDSKIELLVAYCSLQGAESGWDPDFGVTVTWDTPLLDGYSWTHPPNRSPWPGIHSFFGLINPSVWRLIRDGHFDAVLVTGYSYASAWIAIAAAKWTSTPIIFITDSHGLRSWATQSKWKIRFKRELVRRIFSLGNVVLALSSGGVEYLNSLDISGTEVVLTPFAVDNTWWAKQASNADREAIRKEWEIPAQAVVALFCAKLQPWKGPLDLLEAFSQSNVEQSYLVFAGDGPLRGKLEKRAAELGVAERVRFLGFKNQSQLPSVYRSADILVLPSHFEPFGLVVNEAMVCGLPVLVSDRVGARFDLVRAGETGYVFPAGDVSALAGILMKVLPDGGLLARMGANAQRRMESWSPLDFANSVVHATELAANTRAHRLGKRPIKSSRF
jgi:glycosyltransferase involved in cell wall biosynthesis